MALRVNLVIDRGAQFKRVVAVEDSSGDPRNLTGFTAKWQARTTHDAVSTLFDKSATVNGGSGLVTLYLTKTETAAFTWLEAVYDLIIIPADANDTERILEGGLRVSPEVTR